MVQVSHLEAAFLQIVGQVFCHPDGQCCDQYPFILLYPYSNLVTDIIDLPSGRFDGNDRIKQSGRTYDLFDDFMVHMFQLIVSRSCRAVDDLRCDLFKLIKPHRPVLKRRRQTEPVFHKCFLALTVPVVHAADLRQRDMALIHN